MQGKQDNFIRRSIRRLGSLGTNEISKTIETLQKEIRSATNDTKNKEKKFKAALEKALEGQGKDEQVKKQILEKTLINGQTLLNLAIFYNCTDSALYLIESGADPNKIYNKGYTSISLLFNVQKPEITKKLLNSLISHGANINTQDRDGNTILHELAKLASVGPTTDRLAVLISCDADLNIQNNQGHTALDVAEAFKPKEQANKETLDHHHSRVIAILKNGPDIQNLIKEIEKCDNDQECKIALEIALKNKTSEEIKLILDHTLINEAHLEDYNSSIGLDSKEKKGDEEKETKVLKTLAHYAVEHNYVETLKFLVDKGIDLTKTTLIDGETFSTPLQHAHNMQFADPQNKILKEITNTLSKTEKTVGQNALATQDNKSSKRVVPIKRSNATLTDQDRPKFSKTEHGQENTSPNTSVKQAREEQAVNTPSISPIR